MNPDRTSKTDYEGSAGTAGSTANSTDSDWERFAQADPYFAVPTNPEYRGGASRAKFFASGEGHVAEILQFLKRYFDAPDRFHLALDFGCGVGRFLLPLSLRSNQAIGVDVSPTMLRECRRNAAERGATNILLYESDDELTKLSAFKGRISLVTSSIVFQHIPPDRGVLIFRRLLDLLCNGGFACLHFTFAARISHLAVEATATTGVEFAFYQRVGREALVRLAGSASQDRVMQMNHYNLNELTCILAAQGVRQFLVRTTDHDGVIGGELFFRR